MNLRNETIQTYDRSADALAAYFRGIGSRLDDVTRAFELCAIPNPSVVEIGCGDGRDAEGILQLTNHYIGFDISSRMIELARQNLPQGQFVVADLAEFIFPCPTHLIFAFASLLHSPATEVQSVFSRSAAEMPRGGIWYISTKEGQGSYIKVDEHGRRNFYLYHASDLTACAGPEFEPVYENHQELGGTAWLTLALRRV